MARIFRTLPEKGQSIAIAFSGGLDTRCAVAWLTRRGLVVHAYTADLGQPDEKDVSEYPRQKETRAPFVEAEWDLATMEPKSGIYPGQKAR